VNGVEGLLLATGHHRSGILLSAVTGESISALALGDSPAADLAPFSYESHLEAAR
jgi:hydrogen cyanide synthase HcnC